MVIARISARLLRNETAGLAVVMALILPVLLLVMGVSLEFTHTMTVRQQVQSYADGAVLAVSTAYDEGTTDPAVLQAKARSVFDAGLQRKLPPDAITSFALTVPSPGQSSFILNGTVRVPWYFANLFNTPDVIVPFKSVASPLSHEYIHIVFLIDVSNSMSIAGSPADFEKWSHISGCVFVCHDSKLINQGQRDGVRQARDAGIKLKMDFVRSAMKSFLQRAEGKVGSDPTRMLFSVYTVGTTFETLAVMSGDFNKLQSIANSVEVELSYPAGTVIGPEGGEGWSYLSQGMNLLKSRLTSIGDGATVNARKTYVVFLTDGLDSKPPGRLFGPFYEPNCGELKSAGAQLYTIQTYYPPSNDFFVNAALDRSHGVLTRCASAPGDYIKADDGAAIEAAFDQIFAAAVGKTRITR